MSLVYHLPITESASLTDVRAGVTLACTRASTHAMTDDDGWLREVQANEAAFEGARFRNNLHKQSNDFSTSWANTRTTDSQNVGTDPFGGNEAQSINEDGTAASTHYINYNPGVTLSPGKKYVHSVYAKASNRSWILISLSGGVTASGYFNVSAGTVGSGTNDDAFIEDVGNGWYRCSIVYTATGTNCNSFIYVAEGDNDVTFDGLSQESLLIYGVQVEDVSGRWDSENLFTYSNDFTNGNWNESGVEIFAAEDQNVTGPNTNLGWTVVDTDEGTPSSSAQLYRNQVVTEPGRYMFSVYLKANTVSWARLHHSNAGSSVAGGVFFDLANGATGTALNTSDYGIEDAGNGWYRCWIARDVHSDDLNNSWWIQLAEADGDVTYTRDGTHSFYMADAQFERKKPNQTGPTAYTDVPTTPAVTNYSPSDYIATTTVAVSNLVGANSGLHDWPAATNICLQSEDFSTTWTAPAGAVTANQTIAPDGSLTADLFKDDELTGTGQVWLQQSVTVATASQYTFSCFLKADQLSWAFLELDSFTTPASNVRAWFNLATGVVGTVNVAFDDSGIEDYGNGWYRCWVVFTTDAADTTGTIEICVAEADNDFDVTKDGTSSIFVWGAQLETTGTLDRPSPYIRTTTGTATRSEPEHSSSDVSWFNEAKGSIVARGKAAGTGGFLVNINKDAAEYHAAFNNSTTLQYRAFVGTGTDVSINAGGGELANYASATIAAAYEIANYTAAVNGTAGTPNTTNNIPAGIIEIRLGNDANGSNSWGGLIEEVAVFDNYLTQDQLDDVSAGNITVAQLSERRASLARTLTANLTRNLARGLAN